ncbi:hypothetical protein [Acuticoccus kandeliae]|uniref:hypothetical protein n=1 Tax=Acuticoccus kandeliae TaxID=2073160 RepID=UPI000D3E39FF|nr:hypothetical protein [Acuticoccus kandeliae]
MSSLDVSKHLITDKAGARHFIRSIEVACEPLFIARDIVDAMGLGNISEATKMVEDEDKHRVSVRALGNTNGGGAKLALTVAGVRQCCGYHAWRGGNAMADKILALIDDLSIAATEDHPKTPEDQLGRVEDALGDLRKALAWDLLERLRSGQMKASELVIARALLADNGVTIPALRAEASRRMFQSQATSGSGVADERDELFDVDSLPFQRGEEWESEDEVEGSEEDR